jgi:SAM-dependent MidA family methyltransferase
VLLAEAGPGRGTLMADALRAIRQAAPAFAAALRVHLIETSPRLRTAQATRIPGATWHHTLDTVPSAPMILIANEFLDALPIRQFVRRGTSWAERHVAGGAWVEIPGEPDTTLPDIPAAEGDILEVNVPGRAFVAAIAARLCRHPGAALLLDYGPARSRPGDSLQALANKQPVDPLGLAGAADLTAHVDFADLRRVAHAAGAAVQGPMEQGPFLAGLGILARTDRLVRSHPDRADALRGATDRLIAPAEMGNLFKALALRTPSVPPLPGLPDE